MPSSRTSPAAWAGSIRSSRSSSSTPAAPASVGRSNCRPTTAAVRSTRTVSSGSRVEPPAQHLLDRRRRVVLGEQPLEVGAGAGEPGVLDEEERVAVGADSQRVARRRRSVAGR